MKRILTLSICTLLLLTLAACDVGQTGQRTEEPEPTAVKWTRSGYFMTRRRIWSA